MGGDPGRAATREGRRRGGVLETAALRVFPAWVPAGNNVRPGSAARDEASPRSSREGPLDSRGSADGNMSRYLGAEADAGPARRRSPLKRLQAGQSPQSAENRVADKLIEMAVEGGGELSLLSRSLVDFGQFLPLPAAVTPSGIVSLNLHFNKIKKMEKLDSLTALTELKLSSNEISRVEGIGSLLNLKVLDLSCNRLQSVGGLEGLTALERLVLAYNSITSLAGIKAVAGPAYSLQELDLVDNLVSEIRQLRALAGCVHLKTLSFRQNHLSNPVCDHPSYAAVIASCVGSSLHTLDSESLVVHLGRLASTHGTGTGTGSQRRGRESHEKLDQTGCTDASTEIEATTPTPTDSAVRDQERVKMPAKQLQEIFPSHGKKEQAKGAVPVSQHVRASRVGGGGAVVVGGQGMGGVPYMPHVRLVGELGETRGSANEDAIKYRLAPPDVVASEGRAAPPGTAKRRTKETPKIDQVLDKRTRVRGEAGGHRDKGVGGGNLQDKSFAPGQGSVESQMKGEGVEYGSEGYRQLQVLEQELRLERLEAQVALMKSKPGADLPAEKMLQPTDNEGRLALLESLLLKQGASRGVVDSTQGQRVEGDGMLSDVDAEELMALLNTQGASSNGRGGSSGFWSKKSGSDSVSKRGGADVLTIGSDVEEEDSGVRGSYDEQSYEDAAPLVEPRIQVNVVGRTRIGSGLNLNARIEGVMEDEVEPEKRQPAESQRKKGDGSRQEQEQSERGQGAGAGRDPGGASANVEMKLPEEKRERPRPAAKLRSAMAQTAIAWSEVVCRAQVECEKHRGVVLASAMQVQELRADAALATEELSGLSAEIEDLRAAADLRETRSAAAAQQAAAVQERLEGELAEARATAEQLAQKNSVLEEETARTRRELEQAQASAAARDLDHLRQLEAMAEQTRSAAREEARLQHEELQGAMKKDVVRLEEALAWAKAVAQSAQEREQAMAAQRTQDKQESAAQLKKLADRDAQVQEQKSKLLHADVHSGVLLDRLREAARDLGRVGAEVQAMAAQVRDTNERLDEARIREAEMEKAHAAGLAVVQEALQGSQARAEAVEAQRVQAVADAEVLRQKLEEMESTQSLTEEEAGQDGREKKQALEAALAAVETARCDAEKVRVQWRAAEEREARAATVVAELTKLVKDQREKILDAQRDGKETERQLRAALQEALDELQSLQLRQRELARGEKEAGHLRKQLAEERRLVDDLRAELDDVLYERQRLLDLNAEGERREAEAERARDEEWYDGERDRASGEAPKYASPRPDGAGKDVDGDRLTAERETWMQEAEGFRDTIRIKDKILQDQQDSIDKLKEQVVALQAEVAHLRTRLETKEQLVADLDGLVEDLRGTSSRQQQALEETEADLREKEDMLRYVEEEVAQLKEHFQGSEQKFQREKLECLATIQQLTNERALESDKRREAEAQVQAMSAKVQEAGNDAELKARQLTEALEECTRRQAAEEAAHRKARDTEEEMRALLGEMERIKGAHRAKLAQLEDALRTSR